MPTARENQVVWGRPSECAAAAGSGRSPAQTGVRGKPAPGKRGASASESDVLVLEIPREAPVLSEHHAALEALTHTHGNGHAGLRGQVAAGTHMEASPGRATWLRHRPRSTSEHIRVTVSGRGQDTGQRAGLGTRKLRAGGAHPSTTRA